MKFYSFINRPSRELSQYKNFSEYDDVYTLSIDNDGIPFLEKTGVINRYMQIQSHRESCDLSLILANLDTSQVNNLMSSYSLEDLENSGILDYTSLPKTSGDMLNLVKKGEEIFNGLPFDFRQEFNQSSYAFINSFGTQKLADVCSKFDIDVNKHTFFKRKKKEPVQSGSGALASATTTGNNLKSEVIKDV